MGNLIDLAGLRFGRLVALECVSRGSMNVHARWRCSCDCGRETLVRSTNLRSGSTRSCGCLYRRKGAPSRHRGSNTAEYRVWVGLRNRCECPHEKAYVNYGGRGIAVCERWQQFENFLADMGPRPSPKHSIDRIDNNGNYEPGNCRWVTQLEQMQNTRHTIRIEHNGRTQSVAAWARELGMRDLTLRRRLARGWPVTKALTEPPGALLGRRLIEVLLDRTRRS
jgi:hypothetical protein